MKKKLINENRATTDILNLIRDEGIFVASEFVGGIENLKKYFANNTDILKIINSLKGTMNLIYHSRKEFIEFPVKFEIVGIGENIWNSNSWPQVNLIYDDSYFDEDEKELFDQFVYYTISDLNIGNVDIKPEAFDMFKDGHYMAIDFVNGKNWESLNRDVEYFDNDMKHLYRKYMENNKLNESRQLTENKKLENPIEFFYTIFLNKKPIEYKGIILHPTYNEEFDIITWEIENPEDFSFNGELLKELATNEFRDFCSMTNSDYFGLFKKVNIITNLPQGRYYLNEKDKNYVEGILKNKKKLEFSNRKYVYSLNFNYTKNLLNIFMDTIEITTYGKVNGFKVNIKTGEKTKIDERFLNDMDDYQYDNYREWLYDDFYSEVMNYLRQNPRFFDFTIDMFDLDLAFTYDQNLNETIIMKENEEDPTQKILPYLKRRYQFGETNLGDEEQPLIHKRISFNIDGESYSISNFQNKKEQIRVITDMLIIHNVIEPIDPYERQLDLYTQKVIRAVKTFINQVIGE